MYNSENITEFAGLPIKWHSDPDAPADPKAVAWRPYFDHFDFTPADFEAAIDTILDRAGPGGPAALVLGFWPMEEREPPPYRLLLDRADRMTALRSLFLGEMTYEEDEMSWITQSDITLLLDAFPRLERFRVRGTDGLALKPLRHEHLTELAFETAGLPAEIVRAVLDCDLPALTHLELWLGNRWFRGDTTIEDLQPLLSGRIFPALTSLGLRNAESADEVATALASAPLVARLKHLSLAGGTLGDDGAEALLTGQPLSHLDTLDLRHHYLTGPVAARVAADLPRADLSEPQEVEDEEIGRVTAVKE